MLRFNYIFIILSFFLFACDADQKTKNTLLPYKPKANSKADSLEINKPLPIIATEYDTITPAGIWRLKLEYDIIPLSNKDRVADTIYEKHKHHGVEERINYKPKERTISPFVQQVYHPKPIKSGDLRSTGIANENITYLSEEQGLPSTSINHLLQDKNGAIWIAHSSGFSIYNGVQFYNYGLKSGLPAAVTKIILDPSGNSVWMTTNKGLVNYDGNNFFIFNKESGLPGDVVGDIVFDKQNNLWILCQGEAIVKMQKNKLLVFDTSSKMPVNNTVGLTLGKKGEILANTWDSGIYFIDQDNVMYNDKISGKYLSSLITCFFVDTKNNLWCAGYGGGFGIVGDSVTIGYRPNTGFQYSIINSITQDKKNRIWVGTGEGGLICKEKDNFKIYTTKQGLTSNKINCMLHDKAGNVWVGTADGGINKITPGSFKLLSNLDGFTDKPVSRIYVNKRGEILLGTIAGGLYSFNGSKFKHFKTHDFNWKIILGICENDQGDLFVGTDLHGLNKFTYSNDLEIGYDSSIHLSGLLDLQCRYTFNICKDTDGNMWFSNYKISDLVKLTKEHFYTFKTTDRAPLNSISALQIDSDGVVWLSPTSMGLSYIKDNKIVHLTKKNGLVDNQIYALYSGNRNELWIGTSLGLSMYNGKEFLNFTTNDGLSHNSIMSIIKDDEGRVWVATSNGLNCLRKDKQKPKGYSIENFYTTDGLKTNQFFRNSVAFDKNKRTLWWGTQKGAISLELNKIDQNKFSPLAYLANIGLMDDHIDFNALKDSLNKGVDYFASDTTLTYNNLKFDGVKAYNNIPINLSLPYNRNTISFDFYAFGGQSSNKLLYRYMLEGFDETWKNSNLPNAKYSNLNAGDYIFKAQAKLQGLDWSEPFTYKFSVRPPFWNTWWFRLLMGIVIISVIGMIFRWRNRQLILRQQQLEKTVAERTDEITKQKHLIEEKHKEITDSINYAERIQKSFLATKEHLDAHLKEYFILFKPKDIVSGDFYWSSTLSNGHFILVTADSTGHGVPGAIMSLLNITSLEKAIETETEPSAIINTTRKIIIERLKKDGSEEGGKDGMDCSVCVYDFKRKKLSFAAANNPVWIVRGEGIIEIKADKMPVGKHDKQNTPFTQHEIQLQDGDLIYTITDGYADQFGGPTGKKFMSKNLKKLLAANSKLNMNEQLNILENTFADWAENMEQIDDVTIVGVKI